MDALKESITQLSEIFYQRMETFECEQRKNVSGSSNLSSEYGSFKSFILTSLRSLQDQIEVLDRVVDSIEMRSRRKMLLFHGIQDDKQQDMSQIISKVILEQLKIPDFTKEDISRCHRLGQSSAVHKFRPILVKFRDSTLRNKIWAAKAKLKGSSTTISEFLTRPRHEVFMAARERLGISNCWTRDGYIFVLDSEGNRHRIVTNKELNIIAQPLTTNSTKVPVVTKLPTPPIVTKSRRAASSKK